MRENRQIIKENQALIRENCRSQHNTIELLRLFLREGSRQFELRPATEQSRNELIEFAQKTTVLLDEADCKQ